MPWNKLKDDFYRLYNKANDHLTPYVHAIGAFLTPVATAIYESKPVKHSSQGYFQIFRLPDFLKFGVQTRALVIRSAKTNGLYYLIPALLSSRTINYALPKTALYQAMPDSFQENLYWTLQSVMFLIMARLYLRRLRDNGAYIAAYSSLTKQDVEKQLPLTLAEELTKELTKQFDKIFLSHTGTKGVYDNLMIELYSLFTLFFKKSIYNEESFEELKKELSQIFKIAIENQDLLNVRKKLIHDFSVQLADEITTELAKNFEVLNTLTKKSERDKLVAILNQSFYKDVAKRYAADLREGLSRVEKNARPLLPIVPHAACECKDIYKIININTPEYYKRMLHGMLSSAIYTSAITAFTYLPLLLHWFNFISATTLFYAKITAVFLQITIAGYTLEEYKLSSWYCNRHRSQLLGDNIFYGFAIGAAQRTLAELAALVVLTFSGVRNLLTDDAINQFVMQMMIIIMVGYHDRLPGNNQNSINWFYFPQQAVQLLGSVIAWLVMPDPKKPGVRDACFNKIKNVSTSQTLFDILWLIWGKGEISPAAQPKVKDSSTGEIKKSDPLDIVLAILFYNAATALVLELNRASIASAVNTMKTVQKVSTWIARPLLTLPLAPLVSVPLNVLKEPSSADGLDKIQKKLLNSNRTSTDAKLTNNDEVSEHKQPLLEKNLAEIEYDIFQSMSTDISQLKPPSQKVTVIESTEDKEIGFAIIEKASSTLAVEEKTKNMTAEKRLKVETENDDDYCLVPSTQPMNTTGWIQNSLWNKLPTAADVKNYFEEKRPKNKKPSQREVIGRNDIELRTYSYRR